MKRRKFLGTFIAGVMGAPSLVKSLSSPLISRDQLVWGGITSTEISHGSIITNAAQIADSVIKDAHISDLSVDTMKVSSSVKDDAIQAAHIEEI